MLPIEIFCAVFEQLPLRDAITASHVCHRWRQVLTGRPSIWRTVNCSVSGGTLTSLLERSCAADLDLEIHVTASNWEEVSLCLETHLHRCTQLTVRLPTFLPDTRFATAFRGAMCQHAPRLRVLKVYDRENLLEHSLDGALLFGGSAPHLHLLKIDANLRLFSACAGDALKNVDRLLVRPSYTLGGISIQDIAELLTLFPNLTGFAIELKSWTADAMSGPQNQRLSLPRSLKFFATITCPGSFTPSDLLQRIRHQDVERVIIVYNRGVYSAQVSSLIGALREDCTGTSRDELQLIATKDGHRVHLAMSFEGLPGKYTIRCMHTAAFRLEFLFVNLARLSLHERLFNSGAPLPPAPALESLTFHMAKAAAGAYNGIFFLPRENSRVFVCPTLKRLRFAGPSNLPPIHLDPALVYEFIEHHLQLSDGTHPVLHLRRCWLLQNNSADIARLLGMVRDIEIDKPEVEVEPAVAPAPNYDTLLSWD